MKKQIPLMSFKNTLLLSALALGISQAQAADITMTANDGNGQTSFYQGERWSNLAAPSASNDYFVSAHNIRTPFESSPATFAGNSLTISNLGNLIYKGTASGAITIANLTLDNAQISNWQNSTTFILNGNTTLEAGGASILPGDRGRSISLGTTMSGVGGLSISGAGGALAFSGRGTFITSSNSYSGGTTLIDFATVYAQADGALGAGNVDVTSGFLSLSGGSSNDYIYDSATLTIAASMADGSIDLDYVGTDTIGGLSLDGGSTSLAEGVYTTSSLNTLYGSNVFSGTGTLTVVPETRSYALFLGFAALALTLYVRKRR